MVSENDWDEWLSEQQIDRESFFLHAISHPLFYFSKLGGSFELCRSHDLSLPNFAVTS